MEFRECTANAVCLKSNHRVTMRGDDGQIRESVSGHCRSQPGVEWLRRRENDLSASVLSTGKTARIFSSSRILGKKIPSALLAIMGATDSSGIAACLFPYFD